MVIPNRADIVAGVCSPVRCCGERDTLCTNIEGEYLADHDPCNGSPRRRERAYVYADDTNERTLTGKVLDGDCDAQNGDEELANTHHCRSPKQKGASSKAIDGPHARKGHARVDDVDGNVYEEGVLDSRTCEECDPV